MPPSQPGDIVRYEEPERPLGAAIVIGILTLCELAFVVLVFGTLALDLRSPAYQIAQTQWLFAIFFILGFILLLYRRYFMPDVLVIKVRNKKYEDFTDPNRIPKID